MPVFSLYGNAATPSLVSALAQKFGAIPSSELKYEISWINFVPEVLSAQLYTYPSCRNFCVFYMEIVIFL